MRTPRRRRSLPAATQTRQRLRAALRAARAARRCAGARRARAAGRGRGRNRIQLGAPDRATRRHRGARGAGTIRARTALPVADELPQLRARLESRLQALGVETRGGARRRRTRADGAARDAGGCAWPLAVRSRRIARRSRSSRSPACAAAHIINAVIDRTFVDADGTRWVVDFKTSPHEGGDLEGFLDAEVKRYAAQLQRYAHLARELGSGAGARRPVFPAAGGVARSGRRASREPSNEKALRPEASGVRAERDLAHQALGLGGAPRDVALHEIGVRRRQRARCRPRRTDRRDRAACRPRCRPAAASPSNVTWYEPSSSGCAPTWRKSCSSMVPSQRARRGPVGELQALELGDDRAALIARKLRAAGPDPADQARADVAQFADAGEVRCPGRRAR